MKPIQREGGFSRTAILEMCGNLRPGAPAWIVLIVSLSPLCGPLPGFADTLTTQRIDRRTFAERMTQVHEGMPESHVRAILGPPDDVRTAADPAAFFGVVGVKEIWCYGTNGHLTCATLGQVYMDQQGAAKYIYGAAGKPPPHGMFEEERLRQLLRVIDDVPFPTGVQFDPRKLILAANALQPLGKQKAVAAISEYLRVKDPYSRRRCEGVFLLLRVLFEVPKDKGVMPIMRIGAPQPAAPFHQKQFPRFPLMIVDDVPFMLVGGYALGGAPERVEVHLDYFSEECELRARPLAPPTDIASLGQKAMKAAAIVDSGRREQLMILEQFLRLIATVYPAAKTDEGQITLIDLPDWWDAAKADLAKLSVRWDATANCYVFARVGSILSPPRSALPR